MLECEIFGLRCCMHLGNTSFLEHFCCSQAVLLEVIVTTLASLGFHFFLRLNASKLAVIIVVIEDFKNYYNNL